MENITDDNIKSIIERYLQELNACIEYASKNNICIVLKTGTLHNSGSMYLGKTSPEKRISLTKLTKEETINL